MTENCEHEKRIMAALPAGASQLPLMTRSSSNAAYREQRYNLSLVQALLASVRARLSIRRRVAEDAAGRFLSTSVC